MAGGDSTASSPADYHTHLNDAQRKRATPFSSPSSPSSPQLASEAAGRPGAQDTSSTADDGKLSRRSVRHLSRDALLKKRANDREAQRNIRAKTRMRIVSLEGRVRELESGEAYRHLEDIEQENRRLQSEVDELRQRLKQIHIDTAAALGWTHVASAASAATTVGGALGNEGGDVHGIRAEATDGLAGQDAEQAISAQASAWGHNTPRSVMTTAGSGQAVTGWQTQSPHKMLAASPVQQSDSFYTLSPASVISQQDTSKQQPSIEATAAVTNCMQTAPSIPQPSTLTYDADERFSRSSYRHEATNIRSPAPEPQTSLQPQWARLPNNDAHLEDQPHWDRQIIPLIQEKRRLLAAGHSEFEVLGPPVPDFSNFYVVYNTRPDPDVPESNLSRFAIKLMRAFSLISEPPNQIGIATNVYHLLRWYISPTKQNYELMAPYLRPTELQIEVPHPMWVDYVPWPEMRARLVHRYRDMPIDRFHVPFAASVNLEWQHRDGMDTILASSERVEGAGLISITEAFRAHASHLENWSLSEDFDDEFPELRGTHLVRPSRRKELHVD